MNQKRDKELINQWIIPILSIVAICAYPPMFLYFQNADEARFSEILIPMLSFILVGMIHFIVFLFITKSTIQSSVISSLFMLFYLNYVLIEKVVRLVLPNLRYWHIIMIFLFILGHLAWFISKKTKKGLIDVIPLIICLVFCGLILFNGVIAAPSIIKRMAVEKNTKEQNNGITNADVIERDQPNIYYLIFDEYAGFDFIRKYYGYDNSKFYDFLSSNNFSVSTDSHNNSIMTTTVVTNILNLDYVVDDSVSAYEKASYRQNAQIYQLITETGYKIVPVGDVEFLGFEAGIESKRKQSTTVGGETLKDVLISNTVMYPFYQNEFAGYASTVLETIDYLCEPSNFEGGGHFTIMHVDSPHPPFVFSENGQRVSDQNYINYEDKQYYLGQYIYITGQIERIVESILENDPNCVIVLQSDHSVRYLEGVELKDKSNILNAVYFRGELLDIESISGMDTMITVLNRLFDLNISLKG